MQNNILLDYLRELIQRLFKKQPKFFKIISTLSLVVALLTGLPGLFEELGIQLPGWATIFQNKIVGWCTTVAFIISKLTVKDSEIEVPKQELPFTFKKD